jgi:hypothetical protein
MPQRGEIATITGCFSFISHIWFKFIFLNKINYSVLVLICEFCEIKILIFFNHFDDAHHEKLIKKNKLFEAFW